METFKTNWPAIASCAVVNLGLGGLWYGPLFGMMWMDNHGIVPNDTGGTFSKHGAEHSFSFIPLIASAAGAVLTGLLIHYLFQRMRIGGWQDGLKAGGILGLLAFIGTAVNYLFAVNPATLTWIDGGHSLILFALYGLLIGGWQKK